jgi:protein-disulfide isomerase
MNKGTAIVGFLLCFLAGMMLMWGIDRGSVGSPTATADKTSNPVTWDDSAAAAPATSRDAMWGSRNAPVTIVVYSDYECPFCSKVEATYDAIKEKYGPEKLRVIWKHNPLPFHKAARPAHIASETVFRLGGNDAFWKYHKLQFQNNKALTPENFEAWAAQSGVDKAKFKAEFDKQSFAAKIDEDLASGKPIGVRGTPAQFINGIFLSGAQPQAKFEQIIDEQLAAAQKLIASGTPADKVYVKLSQENKAKNPAPAEAEKPKQQAPVDDKTVWKVPVGDSPADGPADALITIVEFSDFECPFCSKVEPTIEQLKKDYEGKIRVVWKHRPLPFHKRATPASILSIEALNQKGIKSFWEAHHLLFKNQKALSDDDLAKYAGELGLDVEKVKAAIAENKYASIIQADSDLADDLEASGTPHFFVNGRRVKGAQPVDAFKAVIDEELKKAEALLGKGIAKADLYAELMKSGKEPPPPEVKVIDPVDGAPMKGGEKAKVQIHIFSDYECPFCKRVEGTLTQVEQEFGEKVVFVWRDKPLPMHKNAPMASQAALEAFKQKKAEGFWSFHNELFKMSGTPEFGRAGFEKIAEQQGLDMAAFKAALDQGTHAKTVDERSAQADKYGISGTPAFVVTYGKKGDQLEGFFLNGALPFNKFKKTINMALAAANKK